MSLTEALATPPSRRRGSCGLGRILDALPEDEAKTLAEALAGDAWSSSQLARVLRDEGHDVGEWTVSRHRKSVCACGSR